MKSDSLFLIRLFHKKIGIFLLNSFFFSDWKKKYFALLDRKGLFFALCKKNYLIISLVGDLMVGSPS